MTNAAPPPAPRDLTRRIARADQDKQRRRGRLDDCYRLAMPWRHLTDQHQDDPTAQDEVFDGTAVVSVKDFAGDLLSTFTPPSATWMRLEPDQGLGDAALRELEGPLEEIEATVMEAMAASNLYEALQVGYADLAVGTMALLVQDIDPTEPIHVEAISVSDLLVDRGPYGRVDGRWRKFKLRADEVPILWPDANTGSLPKTGDAEVDVTDGLYRDLTRRDDEVWKYAVLCAGKALVQRELVGEGACPIIVARWDTDAKTAWGHGPLMSVLPEVKTANYVTERMLEALDYALQPVTSYPDDGVIDVSGGIAPGTWIPMAQGSEIRPIVSGANFDVSQFSLQDLRSRIRDALFQDAPRQNGLTPPTATQWQEQAAAKAKRMGAPVGRLVTELLRPLFLRFAALLRARGKLPAQVRFKGQPVKLRAQSPLLKAMQQSEAQRVDQFLVTTSQTVGPETTAMWIDMEEALRYRAQLYDIPAKLVRSQAQVQQIIAQQQALQAPPVEPQQ